MDVGRCIKPEKTLFDAIREFSMQNYLGSHRDASVRENITSFVELFDDSIFSEEPYPGGGLVDNSQYGCITPCNDFSRDSILKDICTFDLAFRENRSFLTEQTAKGIYFMEVSYAIGD